MPDTVGRGPLENVEVLELGSSVAGPFCGRLLADFGADVVKLEVAEGDPVRSMGKRLRGKSLYAASILRNKRIVSIDLKREQGRELVMRLAQRADVVVENFRPGTLERLGLGYDVLSAGNRGLVLVRISGFGQTGPYAQRAGYGAIGEAISGLRGLTGDPDRPPSRIAASVTDEVTALYGALGAMMALWARQATGRGQIVDAALFESAFSLIEPHVPAFDKLAVVAERAGARLPDSTPNNTYTTQDKRFVHVTALGDAVFSRLAKVIGQPNMAIDPRFATNVERSRNEADVDAAVGAWISERSLDDVISAFNASGVPAAPIYSVAGIFEDEHFRAREMLVRVPDETFGTVALAGIVPKLSETPGCIRHTGHVTGQDTAEVLKERLGLTADEIVELEAQGVIMANTPSAHCSENVA